MKKALFSVILCGMVSTLSAMDALYTLPSANIITQRLCNSGFPHFAQHSRIGIILHEKAYDSIELFCHTQSIRAIYTENNPYALIYDQYTKKIYRKYYPIPTIPEIIYLVLQDYPQAAAALKKNYSFIK